MYAFEIIMRKIVEVLFLNRYRAETDMMCRTARTVAQTRRTKNGIER